MRESKNMDIVCCVADSAKLHCLCCTLFFRIFFPSFQANFHFAVDKKTVLSCPAHGISLTKIQRMLLKKPFWPSDTPQNDEICIVFHVNPDRTKM